MESIALPDGRVNKYYYNRSGRVARILHADGKEELYSHDQHGNLAEAINEHSRAAFERNLIGHVIKETQGFADVKSEYNYLGQRVKVTSSLGTNINIEHNTLGEITRTKASQGNAT